MPTGPFVNQVIRASAGSGKTHQLTNRYIDLLAAGVEPDAILATTFTRKAAGEILDRILQRLAAAAADDGKASELACQIDRKTFTSAEFGAILRGLLRSLHRVRVSTLDSFYASIAGSYHLEIGLPAGWTICEEMDDRLLRRDALERLLDQQPEDVGRLIPLLSKGETRCSIEQNLQQIIGAHYECYRGSTCSAWECLAVPTPPDAQAQAAAIDGIGSYDFSVCGHKGFFSARDGDLRKFEQQDWEGFIAGGLAAKVLSGDCRFQSREIPETVCGFYETLLQQARSEIIRKLADQTRATWNLVDRFHRELWALKQTNGGLYFPEVTQALADALKHKALRSEALAFRLDGAIEHLLLDEFQDTSLVQWRVLEPFARAITAADSQTPRSFFCVGDVKQAIYGWRGGMAEIFDTLQSSLGRLLETPLVQSRRSAQPIIDVVNQVFGNLSQFKAPEKCQLGLESWSKRFEQHSTALEKLSGHVALHTGPEQQDGEGLNDQRARHCEHVARKIEEIVATAPGRSLGVLCRKKDTVACMIYELRQREIHASEEAGNPLTDSPAVEVLLSLLMLADHPGHSVAWFHLQNSPLKDPLAGFAHADALSRELRRSLTAEGYGAFVHRWAMALAPACDRRDLARLQQLVEMAYGYQTRSTLRADDFVQWVRQQRVPDPTGADVRVMTIHAAKGLQFEIVVLPELDADLTGQPPEFVARRDARTLDVDFVCRYAKEKIQALLADEQRAAFDQDRQRDVEESLSLLYVAVTRAIHALHLFIPGRRHPRSDSKEAWFKLLLAMLAPESTCDENSFLYKHGDANWHESLEPRKTSIADSAPALNIEFRAGDPSRRRGLEHVAPSGREGGAKIALCSLFRAPDGIGLAAGTLHHAWFALIEWLDDGLPAEETLRSTVEGLRAKLPARAWHEFDRLLADFHRWLQNPEIAAVLRRSAYTRPGQPGFPTVLAPLWKGAMQPIKVEIERRFLVRDGDSFLDGTLDRIVWLGDGDHIVAADILDFKTDAIAAAGSGSLPQRTEHYRPQMQAYRRAVARLADLPEERIAARLIFTAAGKVIDC